ncbi:MAG: lactonase family protein [Ginsengibacter sp.]
MKIALLLSFVWLSCSCQAQNFYLFTGTYTGTGSKGIYVYRFDASTGKAIHVSNTDTCVNPSYVAASYGGKYIYAVNETNGTNPGSVSSYAFNKNTGKLKFLNNQVTGGDDPCYVTISRDDQWMIVGNYSGGNLSVFRLNKNGTINHYTQLVQDTGSSINETRQEKAHVHSTVLSPDEKYLFTPDLGTDKVMVYAFNKEHTRPLKPYSPAYVTTVAGSGPRHFTFHPDHHFAYLVNELSGTVSSFTYLNGHLEKMEEMATHPAEYKGLPGSADIHTSPDGKFLYVSNRGDENTITIFSISNSGRLRLLGFQPTMGRTPRNFVIDPTGTFLLVANQDTDNIVIFRRNKKTGGLKYTGRQLKVPKPVCLQMIPAK